MKNIFKDNKKLSNMVTFLILAIIVIVMINYIWNGSGDKESVQKNDVNVKQVSTTESDEKNDLEAKLENILSKIDGVGRVNVMITYFETNTTIPIYDENNKISNTTETDDSGGKRTIAEEDNQKQVIYRENSDGTKEPVTQKVTMPKPEGAIITADGGDIPEINAKIVEAVEACTGIAAHKIQVYKMAQ